MRLLFLSTQGLDSPSGHGRFGPLARELARRGHQVELAMLHPNWGALGRRSFDWHGVTVTYVAPMHVRRVGNTKRYYGPAQLLAVTARATLALGRLALSRPVDVIHLAKAQPMNGLAGWLAARLRGLPLYLDCDDYEAGSNRFGARWQQSVVRWWEDHLPPAARGVTVNTTFLMERCQRLGVPAARLRLVPNGFDAERFHPRPAVERAALRQTYGWGDEPVVLYLGSLSLSNHPIGFLLDAFVQVRLAQPAARLWLVGGGEDYESVAQGLRARGLENCVRLAGRVEPSQTPGIYAASDVTVDPVSDDDTARARSPLKIAESLACGVPVVTGDVGDRAGMLAHAQAGVLVKPGDPHALATGLLAALSASQQPGERTQLISDDYRWDHLGRHFETVYDSLAR